jgi:ABC-type transporter MlaC component
MSGRGWVGRGIGRTALVASLVALGPCHAGAEGTTAAGTLLVILGLGQVEAEAQPLKGTAAERKVNLNMATQAELGKLPGVGETTAKKIVAGRPYKMVADLSKVRVSAKTIEKIAPLVSVGETQAPAVPGSSASAPVPSRALASSSGRASESVKSGAVAQILPTTGMVWANVKSGKCLEAVRAVAGQAFDVTETAKRALGLHWQQRTSAERGEFVQLFRDLLERGYLSRIGEYGGEQIKYVSENIDGDHAIVRALIVTKKGTQVPVESRLLQKADRWLIYDVLVENVSLIASYRSQFDRVIRTTSYEELVRRLKGPGTS